MNPFSSNTKLSLFTEPNEGMATDEDTYTDKSRVLFNGHMGAIVCGMGLYVDTGPSPLSLNAGTGDPASGAEVFEVPPFFPKN